MTEWYCFSLTCISATFNDCSFHENCDMTVYCLSRGHLWSRDMSSVGCVLFRCFHEIYFTYPFWDFGKLIWKLYITKWDGDYKMRQKTIMTKILQCIKKVNYKVPQVLQRGADCITKCASYFKVGQAVFTKCVRYYYYKVWQHGV